MSDFDAAVQAMGEIEEYSSNRTTLPDSYYPGILSVIQYDVTLPKYEDPEHPTVMTGGGSPFFQLGLAVVEGPYKGAETESRFYLTPGKGPNIGFVNSAIKNVTGKPADTTALKQFEFTALTGNKESIQGGFRDQFRALSADDRKIFMEKYARVRSWDGRKVIVKVGVEENTWTTDEGEERTTMRNRFAGFFTLTHSKKGLTYCKHTAFPMQEEYIAEQLEAAAAAQ